MLFLWRVDVALLSDCILFLAVCTESDENWLNRGLATRLLSCDLTKKSHQHSCLCACVCVYVHVWEGVTSLTALSVCEVEAVAFVRITWGSTCIISSVSYVCLPQQYIAHLQIAPDGANYKSIPGWCQHGLSSKTRTPSQGEILCKSQLQSPLSLPKNKQPNLALQSGRLTSSSDVGAFRCKGHSSVVM